MTLIRFADRNGNGELMGYRMQVLGLTMATLAVVGSGAYLNGSRMHDDLMARSNAALAEVGLTEVYPRVDWFDVQLVGPPADRARAVAVVEPLAGVRDVLWFDAALKVVKHRFDITITVDRRLVRLAGSVPDQSTHQRLDDAAEESFGDQRKVTLDPGDAPAPEAAAAVDIADGLIRKLGSTCKTATILIDDDSIELEADCFTEAAKDEIEEELDKAEKAGMKVTVSKLAVAPPATPTELQESLNDLIGRAGINFETNSTVIDVPSQAVLLTARDQLLASPRASVEIAGHADARGEADANLELSQRRAEAVVAFMVQHGVEPDRFIAVGYGSTEPVDDNTTEVGLRANRRIEFRVQGAPAS